MCDHIYRAFPDDVPRGAFIPLTEHYIYIKNRQQLAHTDHTSRSPKFTLLLYIYISSTFKKWGGMKRKKWLDDLLPSVHRLIMTLGGLNAFNAAFWEWWMNAEQKEMVFPKDHNSIAAWFS